MPVKLLILTFSILLSLAGSAQTKKIAFESHSGSPEHFSIALTNEFFGSEESNFGLPSYQLIDVIKKITFLSDSVTVIEKSVYKKGWAEPDSLGKFFKNQRDTFYNHPIFSRKNSPDSIRNYLRRQGSEFMKVSSIDSIRFKDKSGKKDKPSASEKEKKPVQEQAVVSFISNGNNNNPPSVFDMQIVYLLLLILLLSLAGGLAAWKLYRPKLQKQMI